MPFKQYRKNNFFLFAHKKCIDGLYVITEPYYRQNGIVTVSIYSIRHHLTERNGHLVDFFWVFRSFILLSYPENFIFKCMDIRIQFWIVACVALFICGSAATAQEVDREMPDHPEKHYKPMPLSPEKSARHATDRMDSLLNLTEKQYDKLYKLNLKWAREDAENRKAAPRMGGRSEGVPNFGERYMGPDGNRPPEGMDRRPPRDFVPSSGGREEMEKQLGKISPVKIC